MKQKDQVKEVVETETKPVECLPDEDKRALETATLNKKLALSQAEKALAENNVADISYKYLILQLYMKHGLTVADGIDEAGNIHRNAKGK